MTVQDKSILKSIGKAVQFWRKYEGLDQLEFSEILGVSRSYIAKLENAHVGLSLDRIGMLADALGVSPYTLLRGIPSDEEVDNLHDIDADASLNVTKEELEFLFCQRAFKGQMTFDSYKKILTLNRREK